MVEGLVGCPLRHWFFAEDLRFPARGRARWRGKGRMPSIRSLRCNLAPSISMVGVCLIGGFAGAGFRYRRVDASYRDRRALCRVPAPILLRRGSSLLCQKTKPMRGVGCSIRPCCCNPALSISMVGAGFVGGMALAFRPPRSSVGARTQAIKLVGCFAESTAPAPLRRGPSLLCPKTKPVREVGRSIRPCCCNPTLSIPGRFR